MNSEKQLGFPSAEGVCAQCESSMREVLSYIKRLEERVQVLESSSSIVALRSQQTDNDTVKSNVLAVQNITPSTGHSQGQVVSSKSGPATLGKRKERVIGGSSDAFAKGTGGSGALGSSDVNRQKAGQHVSRNTENRQHGPEQMQTERSSAGAKSGLGSPMERSAGFARPPERLKILDPDRMKDGDSVDGQETIFIPKGVSMHLKEHQLEGVRFLWKHLVGNNQQVGDEGSKIDQRIERGCTLAFSMGLGKTFTTITAIYMLIRTQRVRTILVVAPAVVLTTWESELEKWIFSLEDQAFNRTMIHAASDIPAWKQRGGVLLISYDMYRNRAEELTAELRNPGPDMVVLDEGHKIRTEESKITQSLGDISTGRRIVLTGYPLQNNLMEYKAMADFVRPSALDMDNERYKWLFVYQIEKGQYVDSPEIQQKRARRRGWILHNTLSSIVLRKDSRLLDDQLPPRLDFKISLRVTPQQKAMCLALLSQCGPRGVLVLDNYLNYITAHPQVMWDSPKSALKEQDKNRLTRVAKHIQQNYKLYMKDTTEPQAVVELSAKVPVLMNIVRHCVDRKEKVVIFTHRIPTLRYLVSLLVERGRHVDSFHGNISGEQRAQKIAAFNDESGSTEVLVISTKAGCEGISLTGANRAVLFDVDWNPSHDAEAAHRIYRFGQKKPVYIYRLITCNGLDDRVYRRQMIKRSQSNLVVDNEGEKPKTQRRDAVIAEYRMDSYLRTMVEVRKPDDPKAKEEEEEFMKKHDHLLRKDDVLLKVVNETGRMLYTIEEHLPTGDLPDKISLEEQNKALSEYEDDKKSYVQAVRSKVHTGKIAPGLTARRPVDYLKIDEDDEVAEAELEMMQNDDEWMEDDEDGLDPDCGIGNGPPQNIVRGGSSFRMRSASPAAGLQTADASPGLHARASRSPTPLTSSKLQAERAKMAQIRIKQTENRRKAREAAQNAAKNKVVEKVGIQKSRGNGHDHNQAQRRNQSKYMNADSSWRGRMEPRSGKRRYSGDGISPRVDDRVPYRRESISSGGGDRGRYDRRDSMGSGSSRRFSGAGERSPRSPGTPRRSWVDQGHYRQGRHDREDYSRGRSRDSDSGKPREWREERRTSGGRGSPIDNQRFNGRASPQDMPSPSGKRRRPSHPQEYRKVPKPFNNKD